MAEQQQQGAHSMRSSMLVHGVQTSLSPGSLVLFVSC
jgi:hypothetical protein